MSEIQKIISRLSDRLVRARRVCWFAHDWSRWELFEKHFKQWGADKKWHITSHKWQRRHCLGCGFSVEKQL